MFWGIKRPINVKTNTIEFKMADKMADRLAKPTYLRAENGNTVFNNVFWIHLVLSWLKNHSIAYSIKKNKIYCSRWLKKMADKVSKSVNWRTENGNTVFQMDLSSFFSTRTLCIISMSNKKKHWSQSKMKEVKQSERALQITFQVTI